MLGRIGNVPVPAAPVMSATPGKRLGAILSKWFLERLIMQLVRGLFLVLKRMVADCPSGGGSVRLSHSCGQSNFGLDLSAERPPLKCIFS